MSSLKLSLKHANSSRTDPPFSYGEEETLLLSVKNKSVKFHVFDDDVVEHIIDMNGSDVTPVQGFQNCKVAIKESYYDLIKNYPHQVLLKETYQHMGNSGLNAELIIILEGITVDNAIMLKLLW